MSEPDYDEFEWPEIITDCDDCGAQVIPVDPATPIDSIVEIAYITPIEGEPEVTASAMLFCNWTCFDRWVEKGRPLK